MADRIRKGNLWASGPGSLGRHPGYRRLKSTPSRTCRATRDFIIGPGWRRYACDVSHAGSGEGSELDSGGPRGPGGITPQDRDTTNSTSATFPAFGQHWNRAWWADE